MRMSNRSGVALIAVACCLAGGSRVVGQQPSGRAETPSQSMIERGRYLVTIQDCNGCHTPFNAKGEPDLTRMLSGHPADVKVTAPKLESGWLVAINATNTAWAGPWGVSYTSNLTSDRVTGIGAWTEQTFIDAIRKGRKSGVGRALLPPMPWPMYGKMTDDDLKAMFAYLRTIKPIRNAVPPAVVAPQR